MKAPASFAWLDCSTPFVLFTGKGGVGKTTIASATAVALADAGRRVLLVSTDPASNLTEVLQVTTGERPAAVPGVPGLEVMDLDPLRAANDYRARVIGPYRGVLADVEVASLEEKLAGACTVEVAAFDTFARLLADPTSTHRYDHVLFDTAPTGHTLRLLSLPAAWSEYLGANPDATSCLGPLAGLQDDRPLYAAAVTALADPTKTTIVLVAHADRDALTVAAGAATELRDLGIAHQRVVINALLTAPLADDPIATAYAAEQHEALRSIPSPLDVLPTRTVPLVARDMVGIADLRQLVAGHAQPFVEDQPDPRPDALGTAAPIADLVDDLERPGHGVILVTGKGGVGKTTIARRLAEDLAARGHRVHLSTTDPAGHAAATSAALPTLTTSVIDPQEATRAYVENRLGVAARTGFDRQSLDLLAEDLRSPCSQEVAVFQAFRQLLRRARNEFVVIDTAPTGHTLLLLDATGSFHRQVMQGAAGRFRHIVTPLMQLQDPGVSRVLVVTRAESTPVTEAADLQNDLRRAGIEPFGWVVNATFAGSGARDPVLRTRTRLEGVQLGRVAGLAPRVWSVPWNPPS